MQYITQEGGGLLRYVVRAGGCNTPPDPAEIERYRRACALHDIDNTHRLPPSVLRSECFLAALDASSKILRKNSTLQRKLLIAAALAETSTRTAPFLLARRRSILSVIVIAGSITIRSLQSLLIGIIFALLRPRAWATYVGR